MRASLRHLLHLLALPCLGCGGPSTPTPTGGIPDPGTGNQVDLAFDNVPPNDTPDQATPLGTSTLADVTVWMGNNHIGGEGNAANYFVFRSAPTPGKFAFNGCYTPPITGLTARLWKVVDARAEDPPVATWKSAKDGDAGTGCLTNESAALEAGTVYLYGLTALGGAGTYSL